MFTPASASSAAFAQFSRIGRGATKSHLMQAAHSTSHKNSHPPTKTPGTHKDAGSHDALRPIWPHLHHEVEEGPHKRNHDHNDHNKFSEGPRSECPAIPRRRTRAPADTPGRRCGPVMARIGRLRSFGRRAARERASATTIAPRWPMPPQSEAMTVATTAPMVARRLSLRPPGSNRGDVTGQRCIHTREPEATNTVLAADCPR